jgi:molybdenum cofactor cytidylyltransferase
VNAPVAGVLLAAGESTRMGEPKPLLSWAGTTLVAWQCRQLSEAGCDPVVVIVGHEARRVRASLVASGESYATAVENLFYREGRASSLRSAANFLAALNAERPPGLGLMAVALLNVDQPRPAWVTKALIEAAEKTDALIVQPSFGGHKSHPVLLDVSLLPELQDVEEATLGLRAVMTRHATQTDVIALTPAPAPFDLDLNTRADYEAALASFESGAWSAPASLSDSS